MPERQMIEPPTGSGVIGTLADVPPLPHLDEETPIKTRGVEEWCVLLLHLFVFICGAFLSVKFMPFCFRMVKHPDIILRQPILAGVIVVLAVAGVSAVIYSIRGAVMWPGTQRADSG